MTLAWVTSAWVQLSILSLIICETLGKSLILAKVQFSHLTSALFLLSTCIYIFFLFGMSFLPFLPSNLLVFSKLNLHVVLLWMSPAWHNPTFFFEFPCHFVSTSTLALFLLHCNFISTLVHRLWAFQGLGLHFIYLHIVFLVWSLFPSKWLVNLANKDSETDNVVNLGVVLCVFCLVICNKFLLNEWMETVGLIPFLALRMCTWVIKRPFPLGGKTKQNNLKASSIKEVRKLNHGFV